jgi:uncharacterized protein (DUF2336 family)
MTADLLSGLEGLVALGRHGGLNMKPILLRVITDQFVSQPRHPARDIGQYEELARQLIADVDVPTALAVARRLGGHPDAPAAIIEKLLDKDTEVAAALFEVGAPVDRAKLAEHAEWGSLAEATAIAGRRNLDANTATALARRLESEVLCALAANKDAPLDAHSVSYLVQRGRTDRELGLVLLARTDLTFDRSTLFLLANSEQRAEVLAAARLGGSSGGRERQPASHDVGAMADLAAAQKWTHFAIELATRLGCNPRGVQEIIRDKSGEPLAVALAALGMDPADAARIFLSSEPDIAHSMDRIRVLTRITSDLTVPAARRVLSAMLGQSLPSEAARHRRYEHSPDVASIASRETALRRAGTPQSRPGALRDRVVQHRS